MKKKKMKDEEYIRLAIDATWENPDGAELRAKIFPEGKPEPKVFIERMGEYIRRMRNLRQ